MAEQYRLMATVRQIDHLCRGTGYGDRDDEAVRDIAPPMRNKLVVPDAVKPLLLIVHRSGAKTWAVRTYPRPGVPSSESIGTWPELTVEAARKKALLHQAKQVANVDSKGEIVGDTVAGIVEQFLVRYVERKGLRTQDEIKRIFNKYVLPKWGERPLSEIERQDITALVDDVADEHGTRQADAVFSYISKLMTWHAARSDYKSPIAKGMHERQRLERDRWLNNDEIRALWRAAPALGSFGSLCQLLLLTGQRLAKVAMMRREEVKDGVWTIPAEAREKPNAKRLVLPAMALAIIDAQPVIVGRPFVFACTGYRVAHKARLDKLMRAELGGDLPEWRIHDLRRTCRTLLSEIGIRPDVGERILGHRVGTKDQGTYDRWKYQREMSAALEALADLVAGIVGQEAADKPVGAIWRRAGRR
jgi:integrase